MDGDSARAIEATDPFNRDTLGTTQLDAQPESVLYMPASSYWPLILALGLTAAFAGALISRVWLIAVGVIVSALALAAWLWPRQEDTDER
jgi:cytochrome c oxidase subunit 1/cytochrome c oxidase subunit I+III